MNDIGTIALVHLLSWVFLLLSLLSGWWNKITLYKIFYGLATLGALSAVTLLYTLSGHWPVSGDFEKWQALSAMLLLVGLFRNVLFRNGYPVNFLFHTVILLISGAVFFAVKEVSANYLIYQQPEVILFFYCRKAAIAIFILAISDLVLSQRCRYDQQVESGLLLRGRKFIILGGALFLAGEFFGSVWALNGWGDPWRWSKGFLLAGAMFLLSMLSFHIPRRFFRSSMLLMIMQIWPLIVIVLLYLF